MAFKFESLEIWKEANRCAKNIYKTTNSFPRSELFGLSDQLKRSSSSISANIAEGSGSSSKKDFIHYLDISIKSVYETVSHLYLARDLGYINEKTFRELYEQAEVLVKRIQSFKNWLRKSS